MPGVTLEIVDHVAALAHLSLTDAERALFTRQLDAILRWAEALQALDVAEVPPMSHALAADAWHDDDPVSRDDRERILSQAPDPAEGLFRVPKVIG